ncbi:MAG: zinc ribbon domain-containing protein [Verrucomicrobiales bacterium]|nr:zinc ribbon domain-containing protein [Verrucomicrobiales bacterium]
MPTYEYTCLKCGHPFDLFQSMAEKPIATCPKDLCPQKPWGKGKVKRGIGGGAGLIFKGSGFYITDYRSDKYKEAAKKDAPPSAAPSKGGKSDGESKLAAPKTEPKPAKPTPTSGST